MRVSNITSVFETKFGMMETLKMHLDAGFDAIDVSFHTKDSVLYALEDPTSLLKEMRSYVESRGAVFNQAHARFPGVRQDNTPETLEYNEKTPKDIIKSIRMCEILGVPQIVIHPIAFFGASKEENLAKNIEHYRPFVHVAKECGVRVLVENMWGYHRDLKGRIVENVCSNGRELAYYHDAFVDAFDAKDNVGVLVDVGHTGLVGLCADDMIREVGGDRLWGIHLHDNDFYSDEHQVPFLSKMNFEEIIKALIEVKYKGDVTFEVGKIYRGFPNELLGSVNRFMFEVGDYFRRRLLAGK